MVRLFADSESLFMGPRSGDLADDFWSSSGLLVAQGFPRLIKLRCGDGALGVTQIVSDRLMATTCLSSTQQ